MKKKPVTHKRLKAAWNFPLFQHMAQDHGLCLLDSEMEDIVRVVEQCQQRRAESLAPMLPKGWGEINTQAVEAFGKKFESLARIAPKVKAVRKMAGPKIVDTGCRCFRCINAAAMAMKPARRKPRGMTYKGQDEI